MRHRDTAASDHLRRGLRLIDGELPPHLHGREDEEPNGFGFFFEAPTHPPLEVSGGPGWFSLFYGSAGFELSLPNIATADWVLAICDSIIAGRVRELRLNGPLFGKTVTFFELCTKGWVQEVTETTYFTSFFKWSGSRETYFDAGV